MPNTFKDFIKLQPNYIVTHINNQGLCNEDVFELDVYYIKLQTDKYSDIDWENYSSASIYNFDLGDAKVIDVYYSKDIFG